AEDGIRDKLVTGVQTCALPISAVWAGKRAATSAAPRIEVFIECPPSKEAVTSVAWPGPSGQQTLMGECAVLAHLNRCGNPQSHRSEERRVGKEWRIQESREH